MTVRDETFDVWIAGEEVIPGLGISYIYVTTPLGHVRMTAEEAKELGQKLLCTADCYRDMEEAG